MRIGKLDAARRQLDAAIDLYFADGDPIAIHTLAAAASQVTLDLITVRGMEDQVLALVAPERMQEFFRLWHEAQNHFKHARPRPRGYSGLRPGSRRDANSHCRDA